MRPSVASHVIPLKKAIADAEALLERDKDWIKIKFETKMKETPAELRVAGEGRRRAAGAEERLNDESGTRSRPKKPTRSFRPKAEQIKVKRDEGLKKAEEHYPPRIAALKEKI